jgi:hypothetical protein
MTIPRCAFTPCLYKSDVYLIELLQFKGAERFHLPSYTYFPLDLSLPASNHNAASFIVDEEIMFLTAEGWVLGYEVRSGKVRKETLVIRCSNVLALVPSGGPYMYGKYVYYVDFYWGKLRVFDVEGKVLD